MEIPQWIEWICLIASWVCLVSGAVFSLIGGLGILRLPDFYSRMHGGGITDTLGAGLLIVGLLFQADSFPVGFKLVAILFFLAVTSPSSGHALARSAMSHGLLPQLDTPFKSLNPSSSAASPANSAGPAQQSVSGQSVSGQSVDPPGGKPA